MERGMRKKSKPIYHLTLYVVDTPSVLARITLIFARRGYQIGQLTSMPDPAKKGFSTINITCSGNPDILEQIVKQCAKLIEVVSAKQEKAKTLFY